MKTEIVTNLKRHATKMLDQLHKDKEPVLITEQGRPSAYLLDAEHYEMIQRRLAILEGLMEGERAIESGRVVQHADVEERLAKWHK